MWSDTDPTGPQKSPTTKNCKLCTKKEIKKVKGNKKKEIKQINYIYQNSCSARTPDI